MKSIIVSLSDIKKMSPNFPISTDLKGNFHMVSWPKSLRFLLSSFPTLPQEHLQQTVQHSLWKIWVPLTITLSLLQYSYCSDFWYTFWHVHTFFICLHINSITPRLILSFSKFSQLCQNHLIISIFYPIYGPSWSSSEETYLTR